MKIRRSENRVAPDGRTDGQTDGSDEANIRLSVILRKRVKTARKKNNGKDLIGNIFKNNQGRFLSSISLTYSRNKNGILFYAKHNRRNNQSSH
jgi:hypothetical protein